MPPNAKYVGRRTRWGNPYKVEEYGRDRAVELYAEWLEMKLIEDPTFLDPLKGKDLACWCRLDERYHADIIMLKLNGDPD